jgi:hypothetical protein
MLTEYGQDLAGENFEAPKLITAILPHPLHGRLVEHLLFMVSHQLTIKGVRYRLSWRDHDLAFYQPQAAR